MAMTAKSFETYIYFRVSLFEDLVLFCIPTNTYVPDYSQQSSFQPTAKVLRVRVLHAVSARYCPVLIN